jgi:uracil-DNA glycosylase
LPEEIENCRPYFLKELDLLKNIKVYVPLGQIAFIQTLKALRLKGYDVPPLSFGHGKTYTIQTGDRLRTPVGNGFKPFPTELRTVSLITTYHPSQQNTQTGKLTRPMFHHIFEMAQSRL